ncbi:glycosyltransferase family 87 protein [Naumannella halotolerans]|uniref:Alpha-1,2-mannosyltransferase n=1 Tax=Naumannella halotolerans TaxID=993414 RepID=A0A4R7JA46_9ACTN|nr:glycosyltransferase family 87 protein [Naumannella halotolerans]TDT34432.1 alpha-1,2-mannosyltransferase [Naumannella halotolerans]
MPNGLTLVALPLPFLAALAMTGGWPWNPMSVDLDVYRRTAEDLLSGTPLYATEPGDLPMTYPPFAAIAALPLLLFGAESGYVVWPLVNAAVATAVFARVGARGWQAPMLAAVMIMIGGPYDQVVFLGQVGIVLMGLCFLDLAPGPTLLGQFFPSRPRLLPRGVLTGLAVAIKMTPALFVVALFAVGRRRPALIAGGAALAATAVAWLVRPADSALYWGNLLGGDLPQESDSLYRTTNQSLGSLVVRFGGDPERWQTAALVACAVAAAAVLVAAWALFRAGEPTIALLVVGLGTSLASPVAWTHTFTWVAPLALMILRRRAPQPLALLAAVYWGWTTVEPFKAIDASGDAALQLTILQQMVVGLGPLLALVLCLGLTRWARVLGRQRAAVGMGPSTVQVSS